MHTQLSALVSDTYKAYGYYAEQQGVAYWDGTNTKTDFGWMCNQTSVSFHIEFEFEPLSYSVTTMFTVCDTDDKVAVSTDNYMEAFTAYANVWETRTREADAQQD